MRVGKQIVYYSIGSNYLLNGKPKVLNTPRGYFHIGGQISRKALEGIKTMNDISEHCFGANITESLQKGLQIDVSILVLYSKGKYHGL